MTTSQLRQYGVSLTQLWLGFCKVVAVSTLVVWLSFVGLFLYYNDTRPTTRQFPERHYPIFNHGHTAWLTLGEHRHLDMMEHVAQTLMVAFVICWLIEYRRRRKHEV